MDMMDFFSFPILDNVTFILVFPVFQPFQYFHNLSISTISVFHDFVISAISVFPQFRCFRNFGISTISVFPQFQCLISMFPQFRCFHSFGTSTTFFPIFCVSTCLGLFYSFRAPHSDLFSLVFHIGRKFGVINLRFSSRKVTVPSLFAIVNLSFFFFCRVFVICYHTFFL